MVRGLIVVSMIFLLSSCGVLQKRLDDATIRQKQSEVQISIPELPESCKWLVPEPSVKVGDVWVVKLKKIKTDIRTRNKFTKQCQEDYSNWRNSVIKGDKDG